MPNLTFAKFVSLCNGQQLNQLQKILHCILHFTLHTMIIAGVDVHIYRLRWGHKHLYSRSGE